MEKSYAFADFLEASGMKLWQVLPMGPTGYGESPYQSFSVHAGNPMLISTEKLVADGLLTLDPGEEFVPTQDERVEFDQVRENKEKLLRKAFHQSEKGLLPEIRQFLRDERWVSDFALFTAVKQHFGGVMWRQWPDEGIRMRRKESLLQYRMMLDEDVRYLRKANEVVNAHNVVELAHAAHPLHPPVVAAEEQVRPAVERIAPHLPIVGGADARHEQALRHCAR